MPLFVFLLGLGVLGTPAVAEAQETNLSAALTNRQQQLQAQLEDLERQIAVQQGLVDKARGEGQTLQAQIDVFNAEIKRTQLRIQTINLKISELNGDISVRNATLSDLSKKLAAERESLAQILRKTQMFDEYSVVSVGLGSESVSSFFKDLDAFVSLKRALGASFREIEMTSTATEAEKEALQARLAEQEQLRKVAELAKRSVEAQEREKQKLLAETKGIEANYQKLLVSTQRSAAQIRSELFALRDSAAIPFGTALQYALAAEKATGTRAAVILGVLKQETNLGENLGTGSWRIDMSPTRDQPIFPYITSTLGFDPDRMPVSKKPSYGWGGAMGPGQFIPSTWVCFGGFINTRTGDCTNAAKKLSLNEFYKGPWQYVASKDRLRKLLGANEPSNPWSPQVAIMATAMLMAENGASKQTYAAERLAALRYFAGWGGASNPAYGFYGDGVMGFAAKFQKDIDLLMGS